MVSRIKRGSWRGGMEEKYGCPAGFYPGNPGCMHSSVNNDCDIRAKEFAPVSQSFEASPLPENSEFSREFFGAYMGRYIAPPYLGYMNRSAYIPGRSQGTGIENIWPLL